MRKLIFLVGIAIFLYPSFCDWWNSFHQSQVMNRYEEWVKELDRKEYDEIWEKAQKYNENLAVQGGFTLLTEQEKEDYKATLSVYEDGMMGYIHIPSIDCRLPIYHGTEESVLQKGAGHMESSSLPIGGENSHCVISGHRGLPSARLFTGLDRLKEGDFFKIQVLGRSIYYEVEQIRIVLPEETRMLQIETDRDLCTLVTCTPYGINSHRLLIRGSRVNEIEEEIMILDEPVTEGGKQMQMLRFIKWSVLCFLILIFCTSPFVKVHAMELGTDTKEQEIENKEDEFYEISVQYYFPGIEYMIYDEAVVGDGSNLKPIEPWEPVQAAKTGEDGKVCFKGIKPGKYLVVGKEHQCEGYIYRPVIFELELSPSNDILRKITVNVKYERKPIEDGKMEEVSTGGLGKDEEGGFDFSLPQTGQLWMPVFVTSLLGILLLMAAWVRSRA